MHVRQEVTEDVAAEDELIIINKRAIAIHMFAMCVVPNLGIKVYFGFCPARNRIVISEIYQAIHAPNWKYAAPHFEAQVAASYFLGSCSFMQSMRKILHIARFNNSKLPARSEGLNSESTEPERIVCALQNACGSLKSSDDISKGFSSYLQLVDADAQNFL